ncbi:hypothetical protein Aduo_001125 [Ancylostoma duodenale]
MIRQQLHQHQQLVLGQNPDVPTTSGQHRNLGNNYQSARPPIFRGKKETTDRGRRCCGDSKRKREYDNSRSSYSRSVRAQRREANMEVIPGDLQNLPDGSRFLHIKRPDLHSYYSEEVIQKACENGINALIGDGVYKLNPKTAPVHVEKGQLHTIHAACNGETEFPILYAVTRSKKVRT